MPFSDFVDGRTLAQAIVDTVREPLLVLDKDLRVIAASRSFYLTFRVNRQETQGRMLYALGDGQWDIPALRALLEKIAPEHGVMEDYEVEHGLLRGQQPFDHPARHRGRYGAPSGGTRNATASASEGAAPFGSPTRSRSSPASFY